MTFHPKTEPADVYPLAIRAEIDAAGIYRGIHDRVRNAALKQKLEFLAREEDRTRRFSNGCSRTNFRARTLVVPAAGARGRQKPSPSPRKPPSWTCFKLAMAKEKEAEEFLPGGPSRGRRRPFPAHSRLSQRGGAQPLLTSSSPRSIC
jgi:hypothetical protein